MQRVLHLSVDAEEGGSTTEREELARDLGHGSTNGCGDKGLDILVDYAFGCSVGTVLSQASDGSDPDTNEDGNEGDVTGVGHPLESSRGKTEDQGDGSSDTDEGQVAETLVTECSESLANSEGGSSVAEGVEKPEGDTHELSSDPAEKGISCVTDGVNVLVLVSEVTNDDTGPGREDGEEDQSDHAWNESEGHEGEWNTKNTKTELRLGDEEGGTDPVGARTSEVMPRSETCLGRRSRKKENAHHVTPRNSTS